MFDIELEGLPPEQEMKKWPLSAKRLAVEFIKLKVLSQIVTIEPKIHRIRFSGLYDYEQIQEKIDNLTIISTTDKWFKKIAIGEFNGIALRIGIYPKPPISSDYFRCMIYKTFNSYDSLLDFKNAFPDLKMSKVEYAIDLKCRDSNSTRNLFNLLRRYLYFPNKSETQLFDSSQYNRTYYVGNKKKKSFFDHDINDENIRLAPQQKMYEWGNDPIVPGKREGWHRHSLHTVRIEYTAYRRNLAKSTDTISDFLTDCKFRKILKKSFKFRKFTDTSKYFPKEWEEYNKKDLDGFKNGFQEEYNQSNDLNPSQHIIEPKGFEDLKFKLSVAMQSFDKKWRDFYKTN